MSGNAATPAALRLYRAALRHAHQLADPCARHYAWGRVTHMWRRDQHETSAQRVQQLLHDARKGVRRLAAAAQGEPAHLRAVLEFAYGRRGRVVHVMKRARHLVRPRARPVSRAVLTARRRQRPQGKGPLTRLPLEPAAGVASDAPCSSLLPLLLRRIPSLWVRPEGGGKVERPPPLPQRLPPPQHWPDWEEVHAVLLEARFEPGLAETAAASPSRSLRRLYEATFSLPRPTLLLEKRDGPDLALTFRGAAIGGDARARAEPQEPDEETPRTTS